MNLPRKNAEFVANNGLKQYRNAEKDGFGDGIIGVLHALPHGSLGHNDF